MKTVRVWKSGFGLESLDTWNELDVRLLNFSIRTSVDQVMVFLL